MGRLLDELPARLVHLPPPRGPGQTSPPRRGDNANRLPRQPLLQALRGVKVAELIADAGDDAGIVDRLADLQRRVHGQLDRLLNEQVQPATGRLQLDVSMSKGWDADIERVELFGVEQLHVVRVSLGAMLFSRRIGPLPVHVADRREVHALDRRHPLHVAARIAAGANETDFQISHGKPSGSER